MLNLIDTWTKAAVEHWIVSIEYYSYNKGEHTVREVEPDYVGVSRDGKNQGLWTTHCHLRNEGPRCFNPANIIKFAATNKMFTPSVNGKWEQLIPAYESKGLKDKEF